MPHNVASDLGLHYFVSCSAFSNENILTNITSKSKWTLPLYMAEEFIQYEMGKKYTTYDNDSMDLLEVLSIQSSM